MKIAIGYFILCVKNEWRERYPSLWSPLALLFSEVTMLTVYWFTAKAFAPAITGVGDYFTFIVIGELALMLPNYFMLGSSRAIRVLHQEGMLELLLVSPRNFSSKIISQTLAGGTCEVVRLLLVLLLTVSFFHLPGVSAPVGAVLLLILSLPLFIGMGLVSAAVVLHFGRGERVLAAGVTLLTVLSGAYFPSSVLPPILSDALRILSPFSIFIDGVRSSLQPEPVLQNFIRPAGFFIGSGFLFFVLGCFLLNQAAGLYGRRLKPLLFRG